jgi:hypothetical protein
MELSQSFLTLGVFFLWGGGAIVDAQLSNKMVSYRGLESVYHQNHLLFWYVAMEKQYGLD